jgi:hypothetical protein
MQAGDGAELVVDEAVYSPFMGENLGVFGVESLHFSFDEGVSALGVFKNRGLGGSELLLVLLEEDVVDGFDKLAELFGA